MKSITEDLQAHLNQEVTTLACCWRVTRRDDTVLGFTDYSEDITLDGQDYIAASGFMPSAQASSAGLAVDNQQVEGVLDAAFIDEADILAGRYDFARVEVFQVNALAPEDGRLVLRSGTLGEVTLKGGRFHAEVRGLSQRLGQTIGALYSPSCRASFGDAKCKKDLAAFTYSTTVSAASSRQLFSAVLAQENGYFDYGLVSFTGGANAGLVMEVKSFINDEILLVLPMPYDIAPGDGFTISAGCDKSFATCTGRFGNALNFRGEPHVPGLDKMLETSATRTL